MTYSCALLPFLYSLTMDVDLSPLLYLVFYRKLATPPLGSCLSTFCVFMFLVLLYSLYPDLFSTPTFIS